MVAKEGLLNDARQQIQEQAQRQADLPEEIIYHIEF
jgi:hypothetical protein